ncbi:MAG: hypothetical protein WC073_10830 [Sterolibacterium sp.]
MSGLSPTYKAIHHLLHRLSIPSRTYRDHVQQRGVTLVFQPVDCTAEAVELA